jgi:hypothetical protein
MLKRRRFKRTTSLEVRLALDAEKKRAQAGRLPLGKERDILLKKARQDEIIAQITGWLASPGSRSSK